ncbi:GNAT family N-acetyltransferase [Streptomyces cinereoruber]|uniref:GNAT family N-acetyltransferase n=1 Tax=Streptomyces cinereoruber TaxID=67260 RepID=UPI00364E93C0
MDLLKDTIEQTDAEALGLYLSEPSPTNRFGIGLVAEVNGTVVGIAAGAGIVLGLPELEVPEEEITRKIGILDVLAVDPAYRRKGIGALLCDTLVTTFQDGGHALMLAQLAAGKHSLVPLYESWGWTVGAIGAGLAIEIGPHQLVISEDPDTRTAWAPLTAKVRTIPGPTPWGSIVSGLFD